MNKSGMLAAEVNVAEAAWEDCNGDGNYLLTTITINGLMMHLEAIAVEYTDGDSCTQTAVDPNYERTLDCLFECGSLEGRAQTLEMNDKEYIVLAHPYC